MSLYSLLLKLVEEGLLQFVAWWEGEDGESRRRGKEKLCLIISYQKRKP